MSIKLFVYQGGEIVLPNKELVLVSREDGGNLVVNPPRDVWERSELNAGELTLWSFLAAATGRAMLDVLPQLAGGCINYWEAGNWALNDEAAPPGLKKTAKEFRSVHLHLLGRSPMSANPSMKWGEAPKFPGFVDRYAWASSHERLTPGECREIVSRVENILQVNYQISRDWLSPRYSFCKACGYLAADDFQKNNRNICAECR